MKITDAFNDKMLRFTARNMVRRMRQEALLEAAIENEATVREFHESIAKLNSEMDAADRGGLENGR